MSYYTSSLFDFQGEDAEAKFQLIATAYEVKNIQNNTMFKIE